MNPEFVLSMAREAITTILFVAAPVLGIGLAVGLVVSIFQATTQIQEPTLAFVPKIAAVLLAVLFSGSWMMRMLMTFTITLWENLKVLF
ncbi:MAG: flagellar biosynthesis protein FliQ [Firmicutes bacterium]|nr:flagellar biosynthesis protein FliQ [Bacillota bacterium]